MLFRLFYAIKFTDNSLQVLQQHSNLIKQSSRDGRFVPSQRLHLTLEFLGDCPQQQLPQLKHILDSLPHPPAVLTVDKSGSFRRQGGDILWLGLEYDSLLIQLHSSLQSQLLQLGFSPEKRQWKPHITIARDAIFNGDFRDYLKEPLILEVDSVVLYRSLFENNRLRYIPQ